MNRDAFTLGYQRSPIIFVGGIASQIPGALMPIISISQSQNFNQGVTGSSVDLDDDSSLFEFMPSFPTSSMTWRVDGVMNVGQFELYRPKTMSYRDNI